MRRITVLTACAALLLGVTGCDFLRTVAGRPTSAELAVRREAVAAEQARSQAALARERAIQDSLAALERHRADSAAAEVFFREAKVSRIHSSALPGVRQEEAPFRYCVVLAGLSQPENAAHFAEKLKAAGYDPVVMKYTRGRSTLVGVGATDDFGAVRASYEKVRQEPFCPRDAWIFIKD